LRARCIALFTEAVDASSCSALRAAQLVRTRRGKRTTLVAVARAVGASPRTLERLFIAETGLTYRDWCLQARLLQALRLLAAGQSVKSVAFDVGYRSPSAFVAAFRHALGTTPGRYGETAPNG
jgi:AraC-like DNA-binding protein